MIYLRGHLARPLDAILGSPARLSAMRALVRSRGSLSGREVARLAGINHQAAALALKDLEKAGVVQRREASRSNQWSVDRRRFLVDETLLPLFEAEVRHVNEIIGAIKDRLGRKAEGVVISGRGAKGNLEAGAPLELMLLCEPGRRRVLSEALRELARELDERFGVVLSTEVMTRKEALSRLDFQDGWQLLPTEGPPHLFTGER